MSIMLANRISNLDRERTSIHIGSHVRRPEIHRDLCGYGRGLATFIAVEIGAGFLSVVVRLIEHYTKSFYLGEEWNNWLGVVFLYWAVLPAIFIGAVVCARTIKSRWNE
jgi:hypothetical protein